MVSILKWLNTSHSLNSRRLIGQYPPPPVSFLHQEEVAQEASGVQGRVALSPFSSRAVTTSSMGVMSRGKTTRGRAFNACYLEAFTVCSTHTYKVNVLQLWAIPDNLPLPLTGKNRAHLPLIASSVPYPRKWPLESLCLRYPQERKNQLNHDLSCH